MDTLVVASEIWKVGVRCGNVGDEGIKEGTCIFEFEIDDTSGLLALEEVGVIGIDAVPFLHSLRLHSTGQPAAMVEACWSDMSDSCVVS